MIPKSIIYHLIKKNKDFNLFHLFVFQPFIVCFIQTQSMSLRQRNMWHLGNGHSKNSLYVITSLLKQFWTMISIPKREEMCDCKGYYFYLKH